MRTLFKSLVAIGAVAVALVLAPAVFAQCGSPIADAHLYGGFVHFPPGADVSSAASAYVYQLSNPAVNSGSKFILCRTSDPLPNGAPCQPEAGGDGDVTIQDDWFNPGTVGCPFPV